MCLNCGCGQPDEDHDNPDNIVAADLHRAAQANDQSMRESAQHIVETVERIDGSSGDGGGLAQPAGPSGGGDAPRGTPETES